MEYTERQTFKISKIQKHTLQNLHKKYNINTSQFIRDAINEKIENDSKDIFRSYKELNEYFKKENDCPF